MFFHDDKKKEWNKATDLIRIGKTLYLKFCNFSRRVAIDKVRPDSNGEIKKEDGYVEQEPSSLRKKRQWKKLLKT